MSKVSEILYLRPVLIYDNYCGSCTTFAKISRILSRHRIYTVGHYTAQARLIRPRIFRDDFGAERMFWIVTGSGAFGGRSGLSRLVWEVVKGLFGVGERIMLEGDAGAANSGQELCRVENNTSCSTMPGFFGRFYGLLRNGKKLERADQTRGTDVTSNSAN